MLVSTPGNSVGYCRHRLLSGDEVCRLPDAMRFSTLVLLGGYFGQWAGGQLSNEQRIYGMTYRQWQAKLAVIDELAANASTIFERKATP